MLGFPCLALRLTEARRRLVHVATLWRLRRVEVEDGWVDTIGCVGPLYLKIIISSVLGPKRVVVF
jgi:hypothetical protein